MWKIELVLRQFSLCSCIIHKCCALLHVKCLTECPSDIFVLNWIQVNSNFWVYTCLTLFNLFWSLIMCLTQFSHVAHTRHSLGPSRHTSCISWCNHMHCIGTHRHTQTQLLNSYIVFMLTWFNTFSMLFEFIYSILS